jgi:hypothetical protein
MENMFLMKIILKPINIEKLINFIKHIKINIGEFITGWYLWNLKNADITEKLVFLM